MRAPAKYMFDADFASANTGKPTIAVAEHTKLLEAADAAGFARGFVAAETGAKAEAERCTAAALERIAGAVERLAQSLEAVAARLETEAIEVAVSVARKLAPELLAREPFAEIAALATECFRHLVATPHVVVRVNDALQATARESVGSKAVWLCWRSPTSRLATAALNGPMAASPAMLLRPPPQSRRRSPATSRRGSA